MIVGDGPNSGLHETVVLLYSTLFISYVELLNIINSLIELCRNVSRLTSVSAAYRRSH
jgi:hypothetical protein